MTAAGEVAERVTRGAASMFSGEGAYAILNHLRVESFLRTAQQGKNTSDILWPFRFLPEEFRSLPDSLFFSIGYRRFFLCAVRLPPLPSGRIRVYVCA